MVRLVIFGLWLPPMHMDDFNSAGSGLLMPRSNTSDIVSCVNSVREALLVLCIWQLYLETMSCVHANVQGELNLPSDEGQKALENINGLIGVKK